MNYLYYSTMPLKHSTFIELEGQFEFQAAVDFKKSLASLVSSNKDLYIDIKAIDSIDIIGLNSLLLAKGLVNQAGGEFYIFVNNTNPVYQLLDKIKFNDQMEFKDVFIEETSYSIAS